MRSCPSCANAAGLRYLWESAGVVRCPRCGLGYVDRLPSFRELQEIYASDAYFHGGWYTDYLGDTPALQKSFQRRLEVLLPLTAGRDSLFEAGCAYGLFLNLARRHWARVQGIDMSPEAALYARTQLGLDVAAGDLESHPPAPDAFDVVAMWDVIEHLYDPVLAVERCAKALRPGGLLALTTGDVSALVPALRREKWRLAIPQHLYYFSRRSLTWLFNAHGLDVVHFSHPGGYRSLRQLAEVITWKRPESRSRQWVKAAVQKLPVMHWNLPVNLHDILYVIGRKRGVQAAPK